ncbi:BA75_00799T0 [Komagataella pastoris]|uniref:BA75_00799T0 n=1 Tax=Komagataella pastoris TaxID=4922 RepID=A0A1B2J7L0_PICPA|nr:BA75_00799T0 [Komagataella pastoris]
MNLISSLLLVIALAYAEDSVYKADSLLEHAMFQSGENLGLQLGPAPASVVTVYVTRTETLTITEALWTTTTSSLSHHTKSEESLSTWSLESPLSSVEKNSTDCPEDQSKTLVGSTTGHWIETTSSYSTHSSENLTSSETGYSTDLTSTYSSIHSTEPPSLSYPKESYTEKTFTETQSSHGSYSSASSSIYKNDQVPKNSTAPWSYQVRPTPVVVDEDFPDLLDVPNSANPPASFRLVALLGLPLFLSIGLLTL